MLSKTIIFTLATAVALIGSALALTGGEAPDREVDRVPPSYCERFPNQCKSCEEPPCGEPIGLVCCEEPLGCFGVHAYSDCLGDIYSCDWGYQGRNDDGTAYIICFDD